MKVSAIIPAFNEEKTIGNVIKAVQLNSHIGEIVVVDDGSSDNTYEIAKKAGVGVIKILVNQGKAQAMDRGVEETNAPVLLFIDADLIGLDSKNLDNLIEPVLKGEVDMSIGTVDRKNLKKYIRWFVQKTDSPVAGQRVFRREFWALVPKKYKKEFYIESALSRFARVHSLKVKTIVLDGVTHVLKEKKYGFPFGMGERIRMFIQMVSVNIVLRIRYFRK